MKLKNIFPKSLVPRFLLIIIIPVFIAQLTAVYIFYERHWDNVSNYLQGSIAYEMKYIIEYFGDNESLPKTRYDVVVTEIENVNNKVFYNKDIKKDFKIFYDVLKNQLAYETDIFYNKDKKVILLDAYIDNQRLRIYLPQKHLQSSTTYIFILWMSGAAILLVLVSIIFMKNQLKPIINLAKAAENFGKNRQVKNFKPQGAKEVRSAAIAFINMKKRIDKFLEQRTGMLAGVSHDLKTPLTRMKLQLAMMKKTPETEELLFDVNQMENMIASYINYIKNNEDAVDKPININTQLENIIASYKSYNKKIKLRADENDIYVNMNSDNFRRVINNIIDNALKFADIIEINIIKTAKYIIINIDDNGPGIPAKKYKEVFKPFYRLDTARNMDNAGSGLGLSITKDLIVKRGGEISLDKSPQGGLRVSVKIFF